MDQRDVQTWVTLELTTLGEIKVEEGVLEKIIRKEVSSDDIARSPIVQKLVEEDFVQVKDFELHSSVSLKGTNFENSVNSIFIRGL